MTASLVTSVALADGSIFDIVVPGSLATVEGNANLSYPFNIGQVGLASQRNQQVYGAVAFPGVPAGGAFVTKLSFRVDGNAAFGSTFSSTLSDIQLNLSTTAKPVDGLSLTFADNVGADDKIVFARGPMALSGTGGSSPNPFNVTISLATPFFFDPAKGNLLLDVRNYAGGTTTAFDASSDANDAMSRVYTTFGADVNSPTANTTANNTYGLVTQFTFEVPEPSSVSLLALGAASWFLRKRRQTNSF